jgi:hypothetical protein
VIEVSNLVELGLVKLSIRYKRSLCADAFAKSRVELYQKKEELGARILRLHGKSKGRIVGFSDNRGNNFGVNCPVMGANVIAVSWNLNYHIRQHVSLYAGWELDWA